MIGERVAVFLQFPQSLCFPSELKIPAHNKECGSDSKSAEELLKTLECTRVYQVSRLFRDVKPVAVGNSPYVIKINVNERRFRLRSHAGILSRRTSREQLESNLLPHGSLCINHSRMKDIITVLETALDAAGDILMHHYGSLERVENKSEVDLVTVADRESEARIKQIIRDAFPDHGILAEESGEDYSGRRQDYRWIVDPLDGTTNFAHSFPLFSVSIGVECAGTLVAGGVLSPFYREKFLAERKCGATLNGRQIHVSKAHNLSNSLLVSGFPYDRRERMDYYLQYWKDLMQHVHGILRLGSAALDLCAVAAGRLDGFWEEKLHAWDTAAGTLIVEEAGGQVTDFKGAPYSPCDKQILATNGLIHSECLQVILPLTGGDQGTH